MEQIVFIGEVYSFEHADKDRFGFRIKDADGCVVDACTGYMTSKDASEALARGITRRN